MQDIIIVVVIIIIIVVVIIIISIIVIIIVIIMNIGCLGGGMKELRTNIKRILKNYCDDNEL